MFSFAAESSSECDFQIHIEQSVKEANSGIALGEYVLASNDETGYSTALTQLFANLPKTSFDPIMGIKSPRAQPFSS